MPLATSKDFFEERSFKLKTDSLSTPLHAAQYFIEEQLAFQQETKSSQNFLGISTTSVKANYVLSIGHTKLQRTTLQTCKETCNLNYVMDYLVGHRMTPNETLC